MWLRSNLSIDTFQSAVSHFRFGSLPRCVCRNATPNQSRAENLNLYHWVSESWHVVPLCAAGGRSDAAWTWALYTLRIRYIEMSELFLRKSALIPGRFSTHQQWLPCVSSGTYWSRQESPIQRALPSHSHFKYDVDVATSNPIKSCTYTRFVTKFNSNGDTIVGAMR